jgi:hypothetical protein
VVFVVAIRPEPEADRKVLSCRAIRHDRMFSNFEAGPPPYSRRGRLRPFNELAGTAPAGSWSISRSCSPTAARRQRTWPCCATTRRCSAPLASTPAAWHRLADAVPKTRPGLLSCPAVGPPHHPRQQEPGPPARHPGPRKPPASAEAVSARPDVSADWQDQRASRPR